MPSLQDLLTQDPSPCPPPTNTRDPNSSSDHPVDDAAVCAIISILSAHTGRFLKNAALRRKFREKFLDLCCLKNSAHAVIAKLGLGIESVERLIEGGGSRGELKIRSLRNAIRLLSVAADVNSRQRSRCGNGHGGFIGGVANSHLSACAHFYVSIVCKIEGKDRASARHLLQVFCDAPYLARRVLIPDLWNHFLLPHLLHLKVWFAEEVKFIASWDAEFREQRMKNLERAYNDQMDLGTLQFALYYKEWIKIGAEAPPIPSVNVPSVAVSRNMLKSVVSISAKREDIADTRLILMEEGEAKREISEVAVSSNSDSEVQQRQSNSIEKPPFVDAESAPCRSYSLWLLSCRKNSNKDPILHTISTKIEPLSEIPVSNLDEAISVISNSDNLSKCEKAIRLVANSWLDSHVEPIMNSIFSASSFIEGLLEVSFTSKDNDVLELAISVLAELVTRSEANRLKVLSADPQLAILLRLSEKSHLYVKIVVLVYLLKPKAKQMLSSEWVPLMLRVLDLVDETLTFFTVQHCPKLAAFYLLDQLVMGFDVDRNQENARQIVRLGGLDLLIKRLEMGSMREKESCASLMATCVRADGSCRGYLVANIKKEALVELFMGNQLKSNGSAISLLCELVCLNRTTLIIEFLNQLKNDGSLDTMHVFLVYLQQAPQDQRLLAAVLLLQLDLLGDSSCCSFYREEGIDAIVSALEHSLHNKKLQAQCSRALSLLGGRFSIAGEAITEAWLLKRAGISDIHEDLIGSEERVRDQFERMEEEEKATENWLRNLAVVLLSNGNKRLLVALSNCIADGISKLARSSLVTIAWMSCSLSSLHNTTTCPQALACCILTSRLLDSLNHDKALEERILASLSLLNFVRHRECHQMIFPLSKETISSLEDLSRVTWTAEQLLFMYSLWSKSHT